MSDEKIITSFGERLALDKAVRALGEATSAFEMEGAARNLAKQGDALLGALLRQLDTVNPTLRGGLGLLAQHIDRDLIVPALYKVAVDTRRSENARLTAVMLLERYLDEEIDPDLAQRLPDPTNIARQSAIEALALAQNEPLVLVEYAGQLLEEPPDTVHAVIEVIENLDNPERARLLLAIAAYAELDVVGRVVQMLGMMRHTAALESLCVLLRLSDERMHPAIERQARKLQMAGVRTAAAPTLRALWSPINAQGGSLLWFIVRHAASESADLLVFALHDQLGVLQAEAELALDPEGLPMPAPRGYLHHLRLPNGSQTVHLAELDPQVGLGLLVESLTTLRQTKQIWPAEAAVFGHWLWGDKPRPDPAVKWPATTDAAPVTQPFADMIRHPAFLDWSWDIPDIDALLRHSHEDIPLSQNGPLHQTIAARLLETDTADLLGQRLILQIRWLLLTNQLEAAAAASAALQAIRSGDIEHPFVQGFAWRSLLTAAADRAARRLLRFTPQLDKPSE